MKKSSLKTLFLFSLPLFSVSLIKGSDLISISCFTKEEKKLYVLGVNPAATNNLNSSVLSHYKKFLTNLSSSSSPTIYILHGSEQLIKNISLGKRAVFNDNLCGLSLNNASQCNFKSGRLEYRASPDTIAELENLNNSAFDCFKRDFIDDLTKEHHSLKKWLITKVIPFFKNHGMPDPFFSGAENKKKFALFKKVVITQATKNLSYPSIKEYITVLAQYNEIFKNLEDTPLISPLKKEWPSAVERALCYLDEYSLSKKESKLTEVLLNILEQKQSYLSGIEAFLPVLNPMNIIGKLESYVLLFKAVSNCNKTIINLSVIQINELINGLEKMGYKATIRGFVPNGPELIKKERSFSDLEIDTHLTSIVHDTFYSQISNQNPIACTYYDHLSQKYVTTSPKDRTENTCNTCNLSMQRCNAFATTATTLHCSLKCLITPFLKQETTTLPLSMLLKEDSTLSSEEKLILKQFGALCYIQAALLMPSVGYEEGIVYQLPLSRIISCLEKIITCPPTHTSDVWKKTLALCSLWKIDVSYIKTFLSMYKNTKDTYLKTLLKTNMTSENFYSGSDSGFSGNKIIELIRASLFEKLKKEFTFSRSTDNNSLLFIYRELVKRIHKRVGLPFERIENLLTLTYEHDDLEAILAYIGYEKNPLILSKKKPKKISDKTHSLSREEVSTSSEEALPRLTEQTFTTSTTSTTSTTGNNHVFRPTSSARKKRVHTLRAYYGGCNPYTISLFKTRSSLPDELRETLTTWKSCQRIKESKRIQLLFALADQAQEQGCTLYSNAYGFPAFEYNDETYEKSLREKLDLGHLFTRTVDSFLHTYGIAECIDNLIQISIPGEITYNDIRKVGFFQYSFTPEWVCIHRCFKAYDTDSTDTYISTTLKSVLYNFLTNECSTDDSYADIIKKL